MPHARRSVPAVCAAALLAVALASIGVAPRARAHGGRPQTQVLLFAPDDPDRWVIEATFGLLTSDDGGETWEWTCQEAMPDGVPGVVQPAVLAAGDRLLVAGTFGLLRSARSGCGWERDASLDGHYVADVVRDPTGMILAVTGDSSSADNGVWESRDEGASFQRIGAPLPEGVLTERMRVAPTDPDRIYISGQRRAGGTTEISGVLLRSDDRGASWIELSVPLTEDDRLVRAAEIDPADADRLWLVVQGAEHDRVLLVEGGGALVAEALVVPAEPMPYMRPYAFARAPDGTIWFGNTRHGLVTLASDGAVVVVDPLVGAACAVVRGEHLYVCGDGVDDGFAVARTRLDAYAPEPVVRFGDVARRTCDTGVDCVCAGWWDDFQVETVPDGGVISRVDGGTCAGPDVGGLDGGVRVDSGPSADAGTSLSPPAPGCACRVPGGSRPGAASLAGVALAMFSLAMFFLRRRGSR